MAENFDQFSRHSMQFRATLIFSIFFQHFFLREDLKKIIHLGWLLVRLLYFDFLVQHILKEADQFFFKVLAKFGDYKHNKDIENLLKTKGGWGRGSNFD